MKNANTITKSAIYNGMPIYTGAGITAHNHDTDEDEYIYLSPDSFTVTGNGYTQNGGYNFPIGNVLSKSVSLSIKNQSYRFNKYDLEGAKLVLWSYVFPNGTQAERNTLSEGEFYISDVNISTYLLELTAYDVVNAMDVAYGITTAIKPAGASEGALIYNTLWDYFVYLCDTVLAAKLGISLSPGYHLYSSRMAREKFPNATMLMPKIYGEGKPTTTLREIFGYIAQLAAGNIVIIQEGELPTVNIVSYELSDYTIYNGGKYDEDVSRSFDGGLFTETVYTKLIGGEFSDINYILLDRYNSPPSLEYGDTRYSKVQISYPIPNSTENGVAFYSDLANPDDNALSLYNPLAQDDADNSTKITTCAKNIYLRIGNKSIKAFEGSFRCNPLLEFMDNVVVLDIDGAAYNSFVSEHTMNYLGYSEIANRTPTKSQNSRKFL